MGKPKQLIIDVREPYEYGIDHVEGAVNIPLQTLENIIKQQNLHRSTPLIVYCHSGNRSEQALQVLKGMGFNQVENGINADHVRGSLARS